MLKTDGDYGYIHDGVYLCMVIEYVNVHLYYYENTVYIRFTAWDYDSKDDITHKLQEEYPEIYSPELFDNGRWIINSAAMVDYFERLVRSYIGTADDARLVDLSKGDVVIEAEELEQYYFIQSEITATVQNPDGRTETLNCKTGTNGSYDGGSYTMVSGDVRSVATGDPDTAYFNVEGNGETLHLNLYGFEGCTVTLSAQTDQN